MLNNMKLYFNAVLFFMLIPSTVFGLQSPDKQFEINIPDGWKSSVMREGDSLFFIMLTSPPNFQAAMQAVGNNADKASTPEQLMQKVVADLKTEYPDYMIKKVERGTWKGVPSIKWLGTFKHADYQAQFQVHNLLVVRNGKFYRFAAAAKSGESFDKVTQIFLKWVGTIQWR